MVRTFCALLLLALVLAACSSDDSAAPPTQERFFFLLSSDAGELHDQGDGTYLLRLTQAWDTVVEFSDRPFRDAATISLYQWVENWAAYGFAADPPNAAITMLIEGSVEVTDSAIMTLTNSRLAADGALEFDAEFLLLGEGDPAFFPTDLGSGVKPSFLTTHVFMDSAGATPSPEPEHSLFLLSSDAGELHDQGDGSYLLRLTEAWDTVVQFAERPFRDAAKVPLAHWVENWAPYGFAADSPNAVITMLIEGSVEVSDWAIVTLTNPSLAADGALEFDAEFLLLDRKTSTPPETFGRATVFIDSWPNCGTNEVCCCKESEGDCVGGLGLAGTNFYVGSCWDGGCGYCAGSADAACRENGYAKECL